MRVRIVLPTDRWRTGQLWVEGDDLAAPLLGPVPCYGKADNAKAAASGNPTRDPLKPFGDHPLGTYRLVAVERDKDPRTAYGPAFLLLDPIAGDALIAKGNGRAGLAIHGGDERNGTLRPTFGCIRVRNDVSAALAGIVPAGTEVLSEAQEEA